MDTNEVVETKIEEPAKVEAIKEEPAKEEAKVEPVKVEAPAQSAEEAPKKRGPKPKTENAEEPKVEPAKVEVVKPQPAKVESPKKEAPAKSAISGVKSFATIKPVNIYVAPNTSAKYRKYAGAFSYTTNNVNGFFAVSFKAPGVGQVVKGFVKATDIK